MMQFAHSHLQDVAGQSFYKLMGSGKGDGFNPLPDWSTYSLLQTWKDESAANAFFNQSQLIRRYQNRTERIRVFFMKNIMSKGAWSGSNPFVKSMELDNTNPRLAVITRATIKWSKLWRFWSYVPTSRRHLADQTGLIYTKGIGEAPIVQMATFSIWENKEALQDFAYRGKEHQKAIEMTRSLQWYKEELFARFQIIREEELD